MNSLRIGRWIAIASILVHAAASPAHAQFAAEHYKPTEAEAQALTAARDHLKASIESVRNQSRETGRPRTVQLADAEIYWAGVDRTLRLGQVFSKRNLQEILDTMAEGEARIKALKIGAAPWEKETGLVNLGYKSEVDGSYQPYQLYVPDGFDFASQEPVRLDIFLHGRAATMNEPSFLQGKGAVRGAYGPKAPDHLVLLPYGRGNNGWRYAGEQDVFEALADVRRRFKIDADRIQLRGFSMGGHGTWHIGLQHPGLWAAMSPGAGFVETVRYQKMTDRLPVWRERLLHLYDPLDYAANAANLPLLHYVGELDPAGEQHQFMNAALKQERVAYRAFIGPKTPHRYDPATLQELIDAMDPLVREPDAEQVDFITYTLRFPECKWVRIEGLERHWERAEVHARRLAKSIEVTTKNVSALRLSPPASSRRGPQAESVVIDGQKIATPLAASGKPVLLVKQGRRWSTVEGELDGLRKRSGLQGPIDDGLFGPALVVTNSGKPWSPGMDRWLWQARQSFGESWENYFRGTLPEKLDKTLNFPDIRDHNLYLFGDPGSNTFLNKILSGLPIEWSRDRITIAGQSYSTADHLPMLIFPNPENPARYVIINAGFTFSRADMEGSNARQHPHLPDYAVIKFNPDAFTDEREKDTVLAGFFDEEWKPAPGLRTP